MKRCRAAGLIVELGEGNSLVLSTPEGRKLGQYVANNPAAVRNTEKLLAVKGVKIP